MAIFLGENNFVDREDGTTVFYPLGFYGKGYVLTSDEQIFRFRLCFYAASLFGVVPGFGAIIVWSYPFGPVVAAGLVLNYFLVFALVIRRATKGLQTSKRRHKQQEEVKGRVPWGLLVMSAYAVLSIACLVGGTGQVFSKPYAESVILGSLGIALGVLGCVVLPWGLSILRESLNEVA